ncbi:MAG TPA: DUF4097 family beta strand repeat-containing protein [Rectinemataceae bacterium]|nr:DUF4097 family beta strand repeat-containing protein [Rectinemataceae bacterium]
MTRKEYIEALSRGLEGFEEDSRRDILLEIEDHIDELALKHPDMSEEEIVAGLEKPETFAECLCEESGVTCHEAETEEKVHADDKKERVKAKTRITIDGEDLGDVIRRAFNVATIFKDADFLGVEREEHRDRENRGSREDRDQGEGGRTLRFKDLPIGNVREIICRTKSTDIKILLSTSGLSVKANGDETPSFRIMNRDDRTMEIVAIGGPREPETLEIGIPSTVDQLSVRTLSGDILVEDRVGDLSIHTASGDVEVRLCSGDIEVTTASGDIALAGCTENISVETASGSVEVEMDDQCNTVSVTTASGDISLLCPRDIDATVGWSTISGDVECEGIQSGARSIRFGTGLIPVKISSASGDIRISRS